LMNKPMIMSCIKIFREHYPFLADYGEV
jgi:hypothetical protein